MLIIISSFSSVIDYSKQIMRYIHSFRHTTVLLLAHCHSWFGSVLHIETCTANPLGGDFSDHFLAQGHTDMQAREARDQTTNLLISR